MEKNVLDRVYFVSAPRKTLGDRINALYMAVVHPHGAVCCDACGAFAATSGLCAGCDDVRNHSGF